MYLLQLSAVVDKPPARTLLQAVIALEVQLLIQKEKSQLCQLWFVYTEMMSHEKMRKALQQEAKDPGPSAPFISYVTVLYLLIFPGHLPHL